MAGWGFCHPRRCSRASSHESTVAMSLWNLAGLEHQVSLGSWWISRQGSSWGCGSGPQFISKGLNLLSASYQTPFAPGFCALFVMVVFGVCIPQGSKLAYLGASPFSCPSTLCFGTRSPKLQIRWGYQLVVVGTRGPTLGLRNPGQARTSTWRPTGFLCIS